VASAGGAAPWHHRPVRASRPADPQFRFEAVYDRHAHAVFRFLAYRVGARDVAEDLTQITFEKALRAWARYDPRKASVQTWLIVIARNVLIDHVRGTRPTASLADAAPEELADSDEPALGPSGPLGAALASLGQRERELIALRFGADLTGPEIAEVTGLTLANVQQILSRALRKLRVALSAEAGGQ
jgi:RNA polymerase sigma-70 factor (ECF subfamily)